MPLGITEQIIASRRANPEARRLALEEAALELEWMARGLGGAGAAVARRAAHRIRALVERPTIGPDGPEKDGPCRI